MPEDDIEDVELMKAMVEEELQQMEREISDIEDSLKALTNDGMKVKIVGEEDKKVRILQGRLMGVVYSIGLPLFSNLFGKFRKSISGAIKTLWPRFRDLVRRCLILLSKYSKQLKLDSIAVTLSVAPSVTVTLRPS